MEGVGVQNKTVQGSNLAVPLNFCATLGEFSHLPELFHHL